MPDASHASTPQGFVAITLSTPSGSREVVEHPLPDFEQSEQGVALDRRLIPWHRVHRVSWLFPPKDIVTDEPTGQVRVVIDDGSAAGEEFTVGSERFEATAWAITVLLDDQVDADAGTVAQRRLIVPWHAVVEYERLVSTKQERSAADVRPDVLPGRPDA
jgi:ribulose bisphosphate carboxylase small subunit